jgi:dienelactone hydrolase
LVALALTRPASRLWKAERILHRLSQGSSEAAQVAQHTDAQVVTLDTNVVTRDGSLRARLYRRAAGGPAPGVVVAHGVHFRGIDEPRLVAFSRALAESGLVVLTPELADLADYRITPEGAERIAESVRWFAARSDLVAGERVGLLGFSFAGGLSLLAAGDPEVGPHLSWVASVGGHHDLSRVLRFFVDNRVETPRGIVPKQAHEYGVVVLAYDNLDRLVPEPEREPARDALRAWLHEDRATAHALAERMTSPEARLLFARLESHRLGELGADLRTVIGDRAESLEHLSPRGKLARITCPVYLLHGAGDSVIPSSETDWADVELGAREHRALVSPLLEHVEVSHQATVVEMFELVDFISRIVG